MQIFIINLLYGLLFLPLALIRIVYKSFKNPKHLARLSERFAFYQKFDNAIDLWIHTVSVGEFLAAKSLIETIIENQPNIKILITTTTLTGSELVQKFVTESQTKAQARIRHVYYPYDVGYICQKFLKKTNPRSAVFFETEIWPRMFSEIKKKNIKLFIINARLSEKSFQGYLKIKDYISTILNKVDYIATQSNIDRDRFVMLGCRNEQISVFGNIKYNLRLPQDLVSISDIYKSLFGGSRTVFIAASTHEGEEQVIIEIFKNMKRSHPDLLLVLAPRHPERFEKVYHLCSDNQLKTVKYTDIINPENLTANIFDQKNVLLVNTIGKLLYFYAMADIAFVGGSLVAIGGHNPLEPALLSVPVILGSNYKNFSTIVTELLESKAIKIVRDQHELYDVLEQLLNDKELRLQIGKAAEATFENHNGVLNKYLQLLGMNSSL